MPSSAPDPWSGSANALREANGSVGRLCVKTLTTCAPTFGDSLSQQDS
jgi:hypothetical protein